MNNAAKSSRQSRRASALNPARSALPVGPSGVWRALRRTSATDAPETTTPGRLPRETDRDRLATSRRPSSSDVRDLSRRNAEPFEYSRRNADDSRAAVPCGLLNTRREGGCARRSVSCEATRGVSTSQYPVSSVPRRQPSARRASSPSRVPYASMRRPIGCCPGHSRSAGDCLMMTGGGDFAVSRSSNSLPCSRHPARRPHELR